MSTGKLCVQIVSHLRPTHGSWASRIRSAAKAIIHRAFNASLKNTIVSKVLQLEARGVFAYRVDHRYGPLFTIDPSYFVFPTKEWKLTIPCGACGLRRNGTT